MAHDAGLDVSLETASICSVAEDGRTVAGRKVPSCPEAVAKTLGELAPGLVRAGRETGPPAVWLWSELSRRKVPIGCMDARPANAALSTMPSKTDRADARGLAQIVRTGWFKQAPIKSSGSRQIRALLAARRQLVEIRCRLENEARGLSRTIPGGSQGSGREAAAVGGRPRRRPLRQERRGLHAPGRGDPGGRACRSSRRPLRHRRVAAGACRTFDTAGEVRPAGIDVAAGRVRG